MTQQNVTRDETFAHRLFILSILTKGTLGVIQLATAAALYAGITDRLPRIVQTLIAAELAEDPNDFLASRIMTMVGTLPGTDVAFYSLYFAAHGLLNIGIVAALLIGATWAYPSAILILAAFIGYQVFEWLAVGGSMLLILSAIDLLIVYLTWIEWRRHIAA